MNTLKIVNVKGGLGNQMFQYAFMRLLQEKYGCTNVRLDLSNYKYSSDDRIRQLRIDGMHVNYKRAKTEELSSVIGMLRYGSLRNFLYRKELGYKRSLLRGYYYESDRSYRDIEPILRFSYFDGYWQSWRYLVPIEKQLQQEFSNRNISIMSCDYINQFSSMNTVSVCVRRGDYLSNEATRKHYGETDISYYRRALEEMKKRIDDPVFVFFSNDLNWVKENLVFCLSGVSPDRIIYREDHDIVNDFEELFVLSSCRNAIIGNSTFHFWGAWLNANPKKVVIAPKEWFKDGKPIDIVPPDWITL